MLYTIAEANTALKGILRLTNNSRLSLDGGRVEVSRGFGCVYMRINGEKYDLTTELERHIKALWNSVDDYRKGLGDIRTIRSDAFKVQRTHARAQTFKPECRFPVTVIDWDHKVKRVQVGVEEVRCLSVQEIGEPVESIKYEPVYSKNYVLDGHHPSQKAEYSRFRKIMEYDAAKIRVFQLGEGRREKELIEQLVVALTHELGNGWRYIGNHNDYFVFADGSYMLEVVLPDLLEEEAFRVVVNELGAEKPTQKPTFFSKIAHALLTDGICKRSSETVIDLSKYKVFDETNPKGLPNGSWLVLTVPDMEILCNALDRPLTMALHSRVLGWLAKGMIVMASQWREPGIYTRGLTILENEGIRAGKPLVPTHISVNDVIVVDSTDVIGHTEKVSLNMQISSYSKDQLLREWEIEERVKLAEKIAAGTAESESYIWNVLSSMDNREILAEGQFKRSLYYRVVNQMLVGTTWKIEKNEQDEEIVVNSGDNHKGLIRCLPLEGVYCFVITSQEVKPGDYYSDTPHDVIISENTAYRSGLEYGSIFHAWRCPSLAHGCVILRCRVAGIIHDDEYGDARLGDFMIINVSEDDSMGWSTVDLMCGDDDGDKWCITKELVERFEPWAAEKLGIDEYHLDSEPVLPKDYKVEKLLTSLDWRKPQDRIQLAGESQTRISDWQARKAMDIFHGYAWTENPVYTEKGEEELRLMHSRAVQATIMAKKHPVNQSDKTMLMIEEICPIDIYRRVESTMCGQKGPFHIKQDENGNIYVEPAKWINPRNNEESYTVLEMIESLGNYPYARVLKAIYDAYQEALRVYTSDPKGKADMGLPADADESRIRWKSRRNYNLRLARLCGTKQKPGLIVGYLPGREEIGMPFELAAIVTGLWAGFLPQNEKSIPEKTAIALASARMTLISVNGKQFRALVNAKDSGYVISMGNSEDSKKLHVSRDQVTFMENKDANVRTEELSRRIRFRIPAIVEELLKKYTVTVPPHLTMEYGSPEEYLTACIETSLLFRLPEIQVKNQHGTTTNWWTYGIYMVSELTIMNALAPEGASVLDR